MNATVHSNGLTVSAKLTTGTLDSFKYRGAVIKAKTHGDMFAKIIKRVARRAA